MGSRDTLQFYGNNFQTKVISSLLIDRPFLQQVSDILDIDYFSSGCSKWIVKVILKYFNEYKTQPTLDVLKIKVNEITIDVLKTTVVENLREVMNFVEADDLTFVQDRVLDFCKNQKLKNAILQSVELLKLGEYDQIKSAIDEAMKAGSDKDIGHEYVDQYLDRFKENMRNTVKTPWDVINEIMDGGLGEGELGVFVAPAGIGKSMALVNAAAYVAAAGLNVIYYSLELSDTYVGARFDSYYTGIPSQDLKFNIDSVQKAVSNLKGKLIIKHYPTKTATINMLAAHIDKCKLQGTTPDLILIDYADLLRDTSGKGNVRHDLALGNIYEELRGMAGTYKVPIWTASQANRSALEEDIIEADKISESYAKVMVADFVVSLSRKTADKITGSGRWHIIKNRFGQDGLTFPSKMNMAVCKINIYAEDTVQGKQAKIIMQNSDEVIRKTLSNKFAEFAGSGG